MQGTASLADYLERELEGVQASVHAPASGDTVALEIGASYPIDLGVELMESATLRQVGEYKLALVSGELAAMEVDNDAAEALGSAPALQLVFPSGKDAAAGSGNGSGEAAQGGFFIGDVRLSQLRPALARVGVASEFSGGVLVCEGGVAVRRAPGGDAPGLVLEGPLSDMYYKVRDVVYAQYHVA
jgi:cleavage and polyadenylation specificity factor subunit 2